MSDLDAALVRLEANLLEAAERNPHSRPILEAFGPLLKVRRRLAGDLDWKRIDLSGIDRDRLRSGVPVIRQMSVFYPDDSWRDVFVAVIDAARDGFPRLQEELEAWGACVASQSLPYFDYFRSWTSPDEALPDSWSCVRDIPAAVTRLILTSSARTALHVRSAQAAPVLRDAGWEKGYCPFCGSFPGIARIHDKITQRWLHCLHCGHEWRFNRVRCPGCEHESPQEMNYVFLEERAVESAFTCEECKRYLVTLYRMSDVGEPDLDVAALGLIHLDLLLQKKGYIPLDPAGWFRPE